MRQGLMESGSRIARQLQRLLARFRFGPMAIIFQERRRVSVNNRDGIREPRAEGTIEITTPSEDYEIPFEDLLAVELAPRVLPAKAAK